MAVQKSKKSRSKRNKRRNANSFFKIPVLSSDSFTGELHIRHFMTETGYYRGNKIIELKNSVKENKEN